MDGQREMLYHTALLVLKKEEDALDAIQETVLSCWENLPRLRQNRYFKTWLTRILLNKCYDILRVRSHFVYGEEIPEQIREPDWDTALDVENTLSCLPKNDRLLLSLYYYDGMSTREIAKALGLSEGAVRTRLTRSRKRFRKLYAEREENPYEKRQGIP